MLAARTRVTRECELLHLVPDRVRFSEDVEALRVLRNMTTGTYAHFNWEITPDQQSRWWQDSRKAVRAWLYWLRADADDLPLSSVVGFGMLRRSSFDGRWWATVGVDPQFTGRGYGGAIMADIVRRIDGPVYSMARLDNHAGMRLHRARDWEQIDAGADAERLVAFATKPHVWGVTQ